MVRNSVALEYSPGSEVKDSWGAAGSPPVNAQRRPLRRPASSVHRRASQCYLGGDLIAQHDAAQRRAGHMRELVETALAFFKECLDWKNAYIFNDAFLVSAHGSWG